MTVKGTCDVETAVYCTVTNQRHNFDGDIFNYHRTEYYAL